MTRFRRRAWIGAAIGVCLFIAIGTPLHALCSSSRAFKLPYFVYSDDYITYPQLSVFWALGTGDPLPGIGDDSGMVSAILGIVRSGAGR